MYLSVSLSCSFDIHVTLCSPTFHIVKSVVRLHVCAAVLPPSFHQLLFISVNVRRCGNLCKSFIEPLTVNAVYLKTNYHLTSLVC